MPLGLSSGSSPSIGLQVLRCISPATSSPAFRPLGQSAVPSYSSVLSFYFHFLSTAGSQSTFYCPFAFPLILRFLSPPSPASSSLVLHFLSPQYYRPHSLTSGCPYPPVLHTLSPCMRPSIINCNQCSLQWLVFFFQSAPHRLVGYSNGIYMCFLVVLSVSVVIFWNSSPLVCKFTKLTAFFFVVVHRLSAICMSPYSWFPPFCVYLLSTSVSVCHCFEICLPFLFYFIYLYRSLLCFEIHIFLCLLGIYFVYL
jgi:hypothetical protein